MIGLWFPPSGSPSHDPAEPPLKRHDGVVRGEPGRAEGFVLPLSLWLLLLLAAMCSGVLIAARQFRRSAAVEIASTQALAIADGVIRSAILAAFDGSSAGVVPLNGDEQAEEVLGVPATLRVESELGKLNLNFATADELAALFRTADEPAESALELARNVVAWRVAGTQVSRASERDHYRAKGRPYGPRFAPLRSVSELALVLDVPETLVDAIAKDATVWTFDATVDRNVASGNVLKALADSGDNLSQSELAARAQKVATPPRRVVVVGEALTIEAAVSLRNGASVRRAVIRVSGDSRKPYEVLSWR